MQKSTFVVFLIVAAALYFVFIYPQADYRESLVHRLVDNVDAIHYYQPCYACGR